MLVAEWQIEPDILEAYQEQLERAPKTIRTFVGKTVINDLQTHLNRQLLDTWIPAPRSQAIPFRFATDRSRRWYFGTRAGGKGIPYQRTNAIASSIEVDWQEDEGVISFVDTSGIGQWLYGERQVPGHRDTGWRNPENQIVDAVIRGQDLIIEGWFSIVDIKGLA